MSVLQIFKFIHSNMLKSVLSVNNAYKSDPDVSEISIL